MDVRIKKLKYVAAVLIYGTIGAILHYVDVPSEIVVFCRGVIGTIFVLLYLAVKRQKLDIPGIKANFKYLVISGGCLGLNWVFLFAAYRHTSVAIASLCNYMAPIIVLALAPFLFKEHTSFKKIMCIIASIVGIVLVSGVVTGNPADLNLPGMGLGLLSALGFVGLYICNRRIKNIGAYDKTVIQLLASAVVVLPYMLWNNIGSFSLSALDLRSILLVLLLGVVHTGVAYIFYFDSLSAIPVQTVAVLGYLEPVESILLSAFFLKEPMGWFVWLGAALILGSAVISELTEK